MLLLALIACTTSELSESWEIDRLRVLAVAAEPAEPRPGDTVTFTSLVVSPDLELAATVWFACLTGGDDYGCNIDPALLEDLDPTGDPEDLEALLEAGLIGAEPYLPPVWTVPETALDGLDTAARLEGVTAIVNVTAIPDLPAPTEDNLELAYKRVPISEATTPNHNPVITALRVDGVVVEPGTTVSLDRGQPYTLEVELSGDSIETYSYVNQDGVTEERVEEPYFTWYTRAGSFDRTFDLWPYTDVVHYAPDSPQDGVAGIWVVVRDRRGGMAWSTLDIRYR
jgi:hypothetical protein